MTLALRAFLNMIAIAAGDPVWALTCVVFGPFRAAYFIGKCLLMALIVALVLLLGVQFAMETLRLKGAWPHSVGNVGSLLIALGVFLRFVSRPMIDHFGDMASDTHGSARFADKKELKPLAKAETGLLIGRDPESGALLRYDGPAHLITMAPARASAPLSISSAPPTASAPAPSSPTPASCRSSASTITTAPG